MSENKKLIKIKNINERKTKLEYLQEPQVKNWQKRL